MGNSQIVERYVDAHMEQDVTTIAELTDRDVVVRYPQSGETIRGRDNYTKMLANFPDPEDTSFEVTATHQPKESVHVQSAPFGLPTITVSGAGDTFFFEGVARYPGGAIFHVAGVLELHDGRIAKETWYFAAPFDAPAWRVPYVEK